MIGEWWVYCVVTVVVSVWWAYSIIEVKCHYYLYSGQFPRSKHYNRLPVYFGFALQELPEGEHASVW